MIPINPKLLTDFTLKTLTEYSEKNPLEIYFSKVKYSFEQLDINTLKNLGFNGLASLCSYLSNYDNCFILADEVLKGKDPKLVLKDMEVKFGLSVAQQTIPFILTTLNVVSTSHPILTIINVGLQAFMQLANFGSITARQRSDDAEHHLDNYRKLIPNLNISNTAKKIFHENIQALRKLRPKCKSLTDNCEKEHNRYWLQSQMYRNFIDSYNDIYTKHFITYDENDFLEIIEYEGINLKQELDKIKKEQEKIKKSLTSKNTSISKSNNLNTTNNKKSFLDVLFNLIDEILSLIFRK